MKNKLVILSLILLANFTLVLAACSDSSQGIMKLSAETNAHASTWDGSSHPIEICYDEIFGQEFVLPNSATTYHDCSSGHVNNIVNLYAATNSHASEISDDTYDIPVCYGNLRCEVKEICSESETSVVKMYRDYNSHMGTKASGYTNNVCCVTNYWADMNGDPISTANLGGTVSIVLAPTAALNDEAKNGVITIKLMEDKKYWFDSNLGKINLTYDQDIMAYTGTIKLTEDLIIGAEMNPDFYFEANGQEIHLIVDFKEPSDDPTTLEISNIKCGRVFAIGEIQDIKITALDSDTKINGKLYINGEERGDFSNGITYIKHKFNTPGEVKLEINSTSSSGKDAAYIANVIVLNKEDGSSIYVPNQNYTAACIASPANYQDYEETLVNFDASTTVGVIIDSSGYRHNLVPGTDPFVWYWEFTGQAYSGDILTESYSNEGNPENYIDEDYYKFTLIYPGAGTKTANLKVWLPDEAWDSL